MHKKIIALFLAMALAVTGLTGCSIFGTKVVLTTSLTDSTVCRVGEETVSVAQAKVFLMNYRNSYEKVYGKGIIKVSDGNQSLEKYTKKTTLSVLAKMKTMKLLAEKMKISLSKEENEKVRKAAAEYYKSLSKGDLSVLSVNEEAIEELYRDMAVATKLYTDLTGGVSSEVSDDDARVMLVKQLVVADAATAKTVEKKLKAGTAFENLISYYSNETGDTIALYRQKMSDTAYQVLKQLDDEEVSHCIQENGKYYFYKIVSRIDRELTNENKSVILKEWARAAFDTVYQKFCKKLSSDYNEEVWEDISLKEGKECTTSSFFEVFDKHLGYLKQE